MRRCPVTTFSSTAEKNTLDSFLIVVAATKALAIQVNLCKKLFFFQNMGTTCCVQKLFWMSETISVHNMFSPGLSLEFSCTELLIQEQSVVILWVSWSKTKCFWQRFTCNILLVDVLGLTCKNNVIFKKDVLILA